jgi:acetylornithine deacetylase/succinyl-diaminopimelate desuccinylase-like protein
MTDPATAVTALARDLVSIDSRSGVSNLAVAERIERELGAFEVERLDYADENGVAKRALVAHRGPPGGLALSGHMDTVPEAGWESDPWRAEITDGVLYGLGSVDMKGPLAAAIVAAQGLPPDVPVTLLITTDEETTKSGAKRIVQHSDLVKRMRPEAILVVEPTRMTPVRGHRAHYHIVATATGIQAHSSSGRGRNANWDLIPFLMEMRTLFQRLREDPALQDPAYDPPFSDFNLILDNHGTAVNVTVPKATAAIKFRYSAKVDPRPVIAAIEDAARRAGIEVAIKREGTPPELPVGHPFLQRCVEVSGAAPTVAPYGTDASELQALAPCVILGPGDLTLAHRPEESVAVADLAAAIPVFMTLARRMAG